MHLHHCCEKERKIPAVFKTTSSTDRVKRFLHYCLYLIKLFVQTVTTESRKKPTVDQNFVYKSSAKKQYFLALCPLLSSSTEIKNDAKCSVVSKCKCAPIAQKMTLILK